MAGDGGWFRTRLGEAVAIVLSILVAFGIDAGWDEFTDRREETEILEALHVEFEANLDLVQEVIDLHERHMADIELAGRLTPSDYDTMSVATASRIVIGFGNPWTFDPALGTTETLISSGRIALIRDREIAEMLTTFVNFVVDAEEDADFIRRGSEYVWQQQYRHGGPWFNADVEQTSKGTLDRLDGMPSAGPDDLRRLWNDPLVRGGARMNLLNTNYYVVELERIRDQVQAILGRLAEADIGAGR